MSCMPIEVVYSPDSISFGRSSTEFTRSYNLGNIQAYSQFSYGCLPAGNYRSRGLGKYRNYTRELEKLECTSFYYNLYLVLLKFIKLNFIIMEISFL